MTDRMGERGRQGAAPLGGTPDIETLRAGVVVMHDGTGRLETVCPDEAALSRLEQALEAAKKFRREYLHVYGSLGALEPDNAEDSRILNRAVARMDEAANRFDDAVGALDG